MDVMGDLGNRAIVEVLREHPWIGDILAEYQIGCVPCKVGVCLLKDVVRIHALPPESEREIEKRINEGFQQEKEKET